MRLKTPRTLPYLKPVDLKLLQAPKADRKVLVARSLHQLVTRQGMSVESARKVLGLK